MNGDRNPQGLPVGLGPEGTFWSLVFNMVVVTGYVQLLAHQTVL